MKHTLFRKILLTFSLFLISVLLLYGYSNAKHESVLKKQIRDASMSHLSFFAAQMDNTILQLETFSGILLRDPNIIEYPGISKLNNAYEMMNKKTIILEKLQLQSASASWTNDITVYAPTTKEAISTSMYAVFDIEVLEGWAQKSWNYLPKGGQQEEGEFVHISVEPYSKLKQIAGANSVVQIRFSAHNIVQMLNRFSEEGKGTPLIYLTQGASITSSAFDRSMLEGIEQYMNEAQLSASGEQVIQLQHESYLIAYRVIEGLSAYVVNLIPLDEMMAPIRQNNFYVYGSILLMLVVSIAVAWIIYLNLQVPLRALVQGIQQMKRGQYGTPIEIPVNNEFQFIVTRFNEMNEQMQELIENVLEEKIRVSEAELKQLQSQINPHFLYNSLTYMVNMIKLDRREAAMQMGYHLADFYRYATRVEEQEVMLGNEIQTAHDYLSIHTLRLERLSYTIDVMPSMFDLPMPRLILQPIVENALIHGIEFSAREGIITITGYSDGTNNRLVVEDNGGHLTEEKVRDIQSLLMHAYDMKHVGCGVSNVHRRLQLRFGKDAGLTLSLSSTNGLRVELNWTGGDSIDEITNSGR